MVTDRYDIVIAGGGMVGASLALALRDLPLRIAMVEAVPMTRDDQPSFDGRSIALSRSSQRILTALDVWPAVREHGQVIRRIHVSERGRFGTAVIDAAEQGIEELGWVVPAREEWIIARDALALLGTAT